MINTRRTFLGGLTGAVAGLTYSSSAAASTKALRPMLAAVTSGSENYWKLVAGQFPLRQGKIMMNAANLCPAPRVVSDRVAELTRDEDSDVSFPNRAKFDTLLEESRKKVAEHIGVSPEEIALVRNTSEANNTINAGYPLKAGDEIVLFDQNHQCNNVAWEVRAARYGFTIKRVSVPSTVKNAAEIVKLFEAVITPQTKVLSITYISNTTGIRLPAKELFSMAHQRGLKVTLDGAQTWGFLKLDLKDIGCDSYAASAHKWFMVQSQLPEFCMSARKRSRSCGQASYRLGTVLALEIDRAGEGRNLEAPAMRRCGLSAGRHPGADSSPRKFGSITWKLEPWNWRAL